jgi:taurine dioxygenase
MSGMQIATIGNSFAREVQGVPLWQPVSERDRAAMLAAYRDTGVLVFRRQALSEDELVAFGRMIGAPSIYAETAWLSTKPEVIILSNLLASDGSMLGGLSNNKLDWHTDQSYYAQPVTGCFLYGVELPAEGGQTSWASLYTAYETLPAALRKAVDGAVGTFSFAARVGGKNRKKNDNHDTERRIRETPDVKHPLVNVNPRTGRKALFIDPKTVTGVDGMADDEAVDLLDQLLAHTVRPENIYDHDWQPGDLVLWDNAVVLHKREGFPNETSRLVKRMILKLDPAEHIIPPVVQ